MIDLTVVVITLLIVFMIFIICRELTCWYWKINEMVDMMDKQNMLIEDIRYYMIHKKEKIIQEEDWNNALNDDVE